MADAPRADTTQTQFLDIVSREEAVRRLDAHLPAGPLGAETVPLDEAFGRIVAEDLAARVDVPAFDRANVDGFAVRSADTEGAREDRPARLSLTGDRLTPGVVPAEAVPEGGASLIATGGMLPRGADAVVMVEHTESRGDEVWVERPVVAGAFVTSAGFDIALGEAVLYAGQPLGSREIGLLAAVGVGTVAVFRRPRVAILSTGDELLPPGADPRPGAIFDSNGAILAAAVRENGGEPWRLGIVADDEAALSGAIDRALADADVVLLSGGTSKGAGDIVHRIVGAFTDPGVIVHGVALKPGKPLCIAVTDGRPVVVLPGFPTSAIFTFHEFVAPVLRRLAGQPARQRRHVTARLPVPLASETGRVDYRMVGLVPQTDGSLVAYPSPKGSGAVTTFSRADGFLAVDALSQGLPEGARVDVQLLEPDLAAADLVAIGSHCTGLDALLSALRREGYGVRSMHVGSLGGVEAARRGECDIAGVHLLDPDSGRYNAPWRPEGVRLVPGYRRLQGLCHRRDDARFAGVTAETAGALADDPSLVMVNRNNGSGTRVLVDRLLGDRRPAGWSVQPSSHNAVAAAVAQGRADWGVTIEPVARAYGLGFIPLADECYDFLVPEARFERPAVARMRALLADPVMRRHLADLGFRVEEGGT